MGSALIGKLAILSLRQVVIMLWLVFVHMYEFFASKFGSLTFKECYCHVVLLFFGNSKVKMTF